MNPSRLSYLSLPHTSRLLADFLYSFPRVAGFYRYPPLEVASFRRAAEGLDYSAGRRQALVEALARQNGDSPSLRRLAEPSTVAVVTGQQVGLFGGPCYTIYKALTAARLTAELNAAGIPAVPIFWLATEDHDFAEVNHAWIFTAEPRPLELRVEAADTDHRPAGEVTIGRYPLDAVRESLSGPYADEVLAQVEAAYRDGATLGEAFRALLGSVLAGFGFLFLDPMDPALRALAAPLVEEAVSRSETLSSAILQRGEELAQAGYHAQVHFEPKTSLVFLLEQGRRLTLHREGSRYAAEEGSWEAGALAREATRLSPNALLRPVVQDYVLPTVAQIGGPAEVAYLAQSQVLYRELGRPAPVVVLRAAFTLVDARAAKLMNRYDLSLPHLFEGLEHLKGGIAARLVPPQLQARLESVRSSTAALLDELGRELRAFDSTLGEALARSQAKILYQLGKIKAKTERQALLRDARAEAEAVYLSTLLYPDRHLQERRYSILPFLARHGPDLPARLVEHVRLDSPDHIVLSV